MGMNVRANLVDAPMMRGDAIGECSNQSGQKVCLQSNGGNGDAHSDISQKTREEERDFLLTKQAKVDSSEQKEINSTQTTKQKGSKPKW